MFFKRFLVRSAQNQFRVQTRNLAIIETATAMKVGAVAAGALLGAGLLGAFSGSGYDVEAVKAAISESLDDMDHDDGSRAPIFIRLAWHSSGTWCPKTGTGGSCGAGMRFNLEANDGANAGLHTARSFLEPIKQQFPEISYSDLWILAGNVAWEEMGCSAIPFTPGRKDSSGEESCPENGRLPDAALGAQHVRDIFGRMGFNDQEMVALIGGGHAVGRCHPTSSGFWGPWTRAPTSFSNEYFRELLDNTWTKKTTHNGEPWTGPEQFEDPTGDIMMLPTDMAFRSDPEFNKWCQVYKNDYSRFEKDFISAWVKLTTNGC